MAAPAIVCALFMSLTPDASATSEASASANPADPADPPALTYVQHRPSGAVFTTAQTPDGYLWFGTMTGLYRFDGVRFARFSPENTPALTHSRIYHLAVTSDGRLYIASGEPGASGGSWERGGPGLVVYERGSFSRVPLSQDLPGEWVLALAAGQNNELWVGTRKGLVLWQNDGARPLGAPAGSDGHVFHVLPDRNGRVWIGSSLGFGSYRNGQFALEHPKVFPVFSSHGPSGSAWMTNLHSVFHLEPGADTWTRFAEAEALTMHSIRAVLEAPRGRLWVGGSGVAHIDLATKTVSRSKPQDPAVDPNHSVVGSLFADNESSVWVGTREGGVFQAAPARVLNFGLREGMPGDVGFAILQRKDGSLLLSYGGGLVRVQGNNLLTVLVDPFAPKVVARSLTETASGQVWLATGQPHIHRYAEGRFARVALTRRGASSVVEAVLADNEDGLWVTWAEGGLSRFDASALAFPPELQTFSLGEGKFYDDKAGVCPGRHLVAARGREGRSWFGNYDHGLTRVEGSTVTCHRGSGLPRGAVLGLFEDEDEAVFFGIAAAPGLFRLREGKLVRYGQGLDTTVHGITKDGRGNLWFGSAGGAYKAKRSDLDAVDPTQPRARIPWLRFTHADGLRSDESMGGTSPAAAFDDSGRFWFPTLRGFSAIMDPERLAPLPLVPPLVERVEADHVFYPPDLEARVPPGPRNLTIDYTSPSFTLPNQLAFEYQLEGFDKDWVAAEGRRTAYYTNLPPGSYSFRVRVRRGDGAAVQSHLPVRLNLAPFFYQRGTFYAALGVLLVALAVAIHRLRLRQVDARHALVHSERARLARELHDHLGQGFTAIGFALDALRSKLRGNDSAPIAEQARGLLEHCQVETRRLVWDLRSEAERSGDVEAALRTVVERSRVAGGPEVQFIGDAHAKVSGLAAHELPLIAQEAVTNALRHARAATITVTLRATEEGVTLTVTDDGVGFPPRAGGGTAGPVGHFGLVGMEERARRLEAKLNIHSAPGAGTEVSVTLPAGAPKVSAPRAP